MKISQPLKVLVLDNDETSVKEISTALNIYLEKLVYKVHICRTIEKTLEQLRSIEIDVIFIDPINLGIDQSSDFIFWLRQELRHIVFVLFCNSDEVQANKENYYEGSRHRFHHYYRLNKKSKGEKLQSKLFHVIHLCLAEIRLRRYNNNTLHGRIPIPHDIKSSLEDYKSNFSNKGKTAFVVMQFSDNGPNIRVYKSIQATLEKFGIYSIRADEYEASSNILGNIQTLMHGCDIGIAVFDRILSEDFNPNVSFEVGYMMALQKPLCILKDEGLKALHTDLVGKLYNTFSSHEPEKTIDEAITKWIGKKFFKYKNKYRGEA